MKKKFYAVVLTLTAVILMAGCGETGNASIQTGESGSMSQTDGSDAAYIPSEEDNEQTVAAYVPLKQVKVEDYVTLGDYSDLSVTVNAQEANDENAYNLLNSIYVYYVGAENGGIQDRAVENGDTVVIDFEGKMDGVAFDGGTAKGCNLTIGSGSFIAGFEDGLIGVMPGETVELNLSFPDPYPNNLDFSGLPVVFTVTVQFIRPARIELQDMQDEVAAAAAMYEIGDPEIDTVEKLYAYIMEYLEEQYQSAFQESVLTLVLDRCEFKELPESMTVYYRQAFMNYYEMMFGGDLTWYFYMYGLDYQEFIDEIDKAVEESVQRNLAFQAIADRENLNVDDEELQEKILEYAKEAGFETVEEYVGDTDMEEWRDSLMNRKVMDFLTERAVIMK